MKKEDFMKLGLDEATAKKCETASVEELKGFVPKIQFDEANIAKRKAETDLTERDGQLETLKNSTGDVATLKTTIATLQADNVTKAAAHADELKQLKMDTAVDTAIRGAKGRNAKAIKALLDLSKAELSDDGIVKGLPEQIAALVKAEDSKFLFDTGAKQLKGVKPGESGKEDPDGKVDTSKMTYTELSAYMAENPDAKID